MARRIVVDFPQVQQGLLAANIVTTDALTTIPLADFYPFVFPNFARTVTFHSTANLSGVTFTITGTDQYGNEITEMLVGPTAGATVTTNLKYHTVTNIEADGALANLSVGSGSTGISLWIPVNNFSVEGSLSLQIERVATITYSVTQTIDVLESYQNAGASYKYVVNSAPVSFPIDAALTNATTNQLFKQEIPSAAYQINVTVSSGNGALTFIILQQGIN